MFIVILKSMESAKNTTDNNLSFKTTRRFVKMYYTLVLLEYTAVIFVLSCTVKIYILYTYTETELT